MQVGGYPAARGQGSGYGPQALLACPPGEAHDMALMVFGIVLNRHGWRSEYLGANTPVEELARAADASGPELVALATTLPQTLEPLHPELASLTRRVPLAPASRPRPVSVPRLARAGRAVRPDPLGQVQLRVDRQARLVVLGLDPLEVGPGRLRRAASATTA
jgi:MerR family transcriptional regulator, light-induced transcriptional regulator